jgi:hypothetical protein
MLNKYSSVKSVLALVLAAGFILTGCNKDNNADPQPTYETPETYNFENVSHTGQTERLDMLAEMVAEMKKGNTKGTVVDAQKLKDMYANANNHFSFTSANQLKNKTFEPDRALFESWMDTLAIASSSLLDGSNGIAGVVVSNDKSKQYLFDANGVELTQIIEKGLMGAVFYYQASSVYLSDEKIGASVDNSTVTPGKGTTMEHHWDEAFGYYGVPKDFPGNKTGIRYHGKYGNDRDALVETNKIMKEGFIKGRAAISNKDMNGKDEAVAKVREHWERVIASTAISYLNKAKADMADDALRNHSLSEAKAFIMSLKYNIGKKISNEQIDAVINHLGANFYEIELEHINAARNQLSTIYGMDSIKDKL